MDEHSRILIEDYCRAHRRTKKGRLLQKLVDLSVSMERNPDDWEMLELSQYIA